MDGQASTKAVFFDLHGTLLVFPAFDSANTLWVGAFHDLVGRPNGLSLDQVNTICGAILDSPHARDAAAELTTYEMKISRSFEELDIILPHAELHRVADATVEAWQGSLRLAEDAVDVLRSLQHRVRTVLITNFDHSPHVRRVLATHGLQPLLDDVIISDEVGLNKPQPEIFQLALRRAGLSSRQVTHVGDSLRDDVEGALSAGISPILIDRNTKSHADQGSGTVRVHGGYRSIHSLTELLELV